jgi:hypothetical protein
MGSSESLSPNVVYCKQCQLFIIKTDCVHGAENHSELSVHVATQLQNLCQRLRYAEPMVKRLLVVSDQHDQLVERNAQTEDSNTKLSEQNAQLIASRKSDAVMIANMRLEAKRQTDLVQQLSKQIERLKEVDAQCLRLNDEKLSLIDKDTQNRQTIEALKRSVSTLGAECARLEDLHDNLYNKLNDEHQQLLTQFATLSKFDAETQSQYHESQRQLVALKRDTTTTIDQLRG